MIYSIVMNEPTSQALLAYAIKIPEDYRAQLEKLSNFSKTSEHLSSINACIQQAIEEYLSLPQGVQPEPSLPKVPLRGFTVYITSEMKQNISHCAASWQLKRAYPVSMNSVVNTAILTFLQNHIQGYQQAF